MRWMKKARWQNGNGKGKFEKEEKKEFRVQGI
jgi:hypothetical protein